MAKKIYVGNLSFSTTKESLEKAFSVYGKITEATVITNKFNGRSKGFGFVSFENDADADKAVAEMNGKEMEGRQLTVNEAKPFDPNAPRKEFRPRGGGFGGNRGGFGGGRGGGFGGSRDGGSRGGFKRRDSGSDDF